MLGPRYAFISAYLKGEEARTVAPEHMDRMLTASSLQDALAVVRETDVGSYLEELPVETFDDLDEYLWQYLARRISQVESFKFLPKDVLKLSEAYVIKYDVRNTKAALQGISTGKKASMIPVGVIHKSGLLDELSSCSDVEEIIKVLIRCKLGDYVPALQQYRADKGAKSSLAAEAKLDGEYYKNLLNMARRIKDGSVLARAFGLVIDLTNLQMVFRCVIGHVAVDAADFVIAGGYRLSDKVMKDLLALKVGDIAARLDDAQYQEIASEVSATYDKTKSITAVDEIIDKHKFRMLRELLSPRVLSPLVMAWYVVLKEVEIRNLRLVLKAIIDGIPPQQVRDYLVL